MLLCFAGVLLRVAESTTVAGLTCYCLAGACALADCLIALLLSVEIPPLALEIEAFWAIVTPEGGAARMFSLWADSLPALAPSLLQFLFAIMRVTY